VLILGRVALPLLKPIADQTAEHAVRTDSPLA
jgi:hypothetical protein